MRKVLLIDDDEGIQDAIGSILEFEGFETHAVGSAQEVGIALKSQKPDVILLDLLLDGTSGTTIAKNLKSNLDTAGIPIIMMSAHPTAKASAQECGADDFIAKPFDVDTLIGKINQYTNK